MEELFEQELGPLNSDVEGPGLCGNIGRMHAKLEQLLLRVEFFLWCFTFNEHFASIPLTYVLLLQDCLHIRQVARVAGHIGGQNDTNEALTEGFVVVARKFFQEVEI